jgi:predicted enzyme related to lactoylglutathione lyase
MNHATRSAPRSAPLAAVLLLTLAACGPSDAAPEEDAPAVTETTMSVPDIRATNAFYYYRDVDGAWAFYTDVLGLETAADFGFAKIMRVAEASYLTLVDAEEGMHSADEPKSVTLAIVTEQVEEWWDRLSEQGVEMRADFNYREGQAHDGFVAVDPEGYFLEVERFNPHEENVGLMSILDAVEPITTTHDLTIQGTVFWLYYGELAPNEAFYERLLGVDLLVDQGWAKVYQASPTGFVGLVDGARGLHQATEEKGVTISFFTTDIEAWVERIRAQGLETRSEEIGDESGRVRTFVAYDNEGYFLEWDAFLDVEGNERLVEALGRR